MLNFKFKKSFAVVLAGLISCFSIVFVYAGDNGNPPSSITKSAETSFDEKAIKNKLKESLGLDVEQVMTTQLPGIALVVTNQGLFYTSYDGEFFIQGKVYKVGENVTNLADESLAKIRLDGMEKFSKDMIIFPAKDEKHVVTVFTDITCGYCRKLHDQMADYNARGITVRYLPYPRSGMYDQSGALSQGYQDLRSIWCNEDPKSALTKAKSGSGVAHRICDKPIEAEFNFGRQIGVNGTPAIILANGTMLPGYQDPAKLAEILAQL